MPLKQLLAAATTRVRAKAMPRGAKAIGLLPEQSVAYTGFRVFDTRVGSQHFTMATSSAQPRSKLHVGSNLDTLVKATAMGIGWKASALSPDQVAAAAAAWHQHAAAGADDESLLVLARALGLVMQDADGGLLLHPQLVAGLEAPAAPSTSLPSLPNPASGSSMLSGAQLLTSQLQGGPGQLLLQQPQQLSSAVPAAAMPAAILCQQLQAQQQQQQQVSALAAAGLAALLSSGLSVAQCASLGLSLAAPGGAGAAAGAGAARHSHSSGSGLGPVKQHALYKFAHGAEELRPVPRHPKYKTEVCRTFTLNGTCVYGARCRFLHAHTSAPNALFNGDGLLLLGETGEESRAHLAEEVQLEGSWDTQLRAGQQAHLASALYSQTSTSPHALSASAGNSSELPAPLAAHMLRRSIDLANCSTQHSHGQASFTSNASPTYPQALPLDAFSFSPLGQQRQQQQQQQQQVSPSSSSVMRGSVGQGAGGQQHHTATHLATHMDRLTSADVSSLSSPALASPSLATLQLLRNSNPHTPPSPPLYTSAASGTSGQGCRVQQLVQQAGAARTSTRTSLDSRTSRTSMESALPGPTYPTLGPAPLGPLGPASSPFPWLGSPPQALMSARASFESAYSGTSRSSALPTLAAHPMPSMGMGTDTAETDRVRRWAEAAAGHVLGLGAPLGPDALLGCGDGLDLGGVEGRGKELGRVQWVGHGGAVAGQESEEGDEDEEGSNRRLNHQLTMTQLQAGQGTTRVSDPTAGGQGVGPSRSGMVEPPLATSVPGAQLQAHVQAQLLLQLQAQHEQQMQQLAAQHRQQMQQETEKAERVRRLSASMAQQQQQQQLYGMDMQLLMAQQQLAAAQFAATTAATGSNAFPGFASISKAEWQPQPQPQQQRRPSWQQQEAEVQSQMSGELQRLLAALNTSGAELTPVDVRSPMPGAPQLVRPGAAPRLPAHGSRQLDSSMTLQS
ncbi:hypothetical protein QJQ45_018728 [Haematococcus lacustris]|nr:hypothetical protein QJQ45_018728 [Haematococcus lacustris]